MQPLSITETTTRQGTELGLPEVHILTPCAVDSEFYGASYAASVYCGFEHPPKPVRGYWTHGWGPKQFLAFDSPVLYFGLADLKRTGDYHWVGRLDEENLLRRHGYKNAKAIGLPLVYVLPKETKRRPGSLLVMPAHSCDDTTSDWKFDEYANEVARMRPSFSEVWVCIHPSCWEHGYWVDAFKKRGFAVVQGALYTDRNALQRVYRLLSSFEYVTTNTVGSHVAYAAALGAKVSIYGSYAELRDVNFNNLPEYVPMKNKWDWACAETTMRQYYPELFCHPLEAKQRIDWGRYEIGSDNKVTPAELRSLFGWTHRGRLAHAGRCIAGQVVEKIRECYRLVVPYRMRHRASMVRSAVYRQEYETRTELQRLECMARYTAATTNLLGKSFELVDSKSFLAQHKAIFERQIYRLETRKEMPLIIDGGANVGLSVLYFKRVLPNSRIIAFEPDPDIFKVLSKNCAAFQLENVELIPRALWSQEAVVMFDREGADAGRIMADTTSVQAVRACACRLRDYLDQDVDLLKLDLEGTELDVLADCAELLRNVRNIVVEYHSFREEPQKLHIITKILHDAGFRLHVHGAMVSPQPLWWRQVVKGMDMRLHLYGFRS